MAIPIATSIAIMSICQIPKNIIGLSARQWWTAVSLFVLPTIKKTKGTEVARELIVR